MATFYLSFGAGVGSTVDLDLVLCTFAIEATVDVRSPLCVFNVLVDFSSINVFAFKLISGCQLGSMLVQYAASGLVRDSFVVNKTLALGSKQSDDNNRKFPPKLSMIHSEV